jgi:hypothetical protein
MNSNDIVLVKLVRIRSTSPHLSDKGTGEIRSISE